MTMITQMLDIPSEVDPMDAITEKVLAALKPRKTRRVCHIKPVATDANVFASFKNTVLAAPQSARVAALQLADQLTTRTAGGGRDSLEACEHEFGVCIDVFRTVRADVGRECHERGALMDELLTRVAAAFECSCDAAKRHKDVATKLDGELRAAEADSTGLRDKLQSMAEELKSARIKLVAAEAKMRFLELKRKSEEPVKVVAPRGRSICVSRLRLSHLARESMSSELEDIIPTSDACTSPMMMFNSFTRGTFMTGAEDDQISPSDAPWSACERLNIPSISRQDNEPTATRASVIPRLSMHHSVPDTERGRSPSVYSRSRSRRETNTSGCHMSVATSKSKRRQNEEFPPVLAFHNFVRLNTDWEYSHDPALIRAYEELQAELAEAQSENATQTKNSQRVEEVVGNTLHQLATSVGRVRSALNSSEEDGQRGKMDLDTILGAVNKVLHELQSNSCHEWSNIEVGARVSERFAEFCSLEARISHAPRRMRTQTSRWQASTNLAADPKANCIAEKEVAPITSSRSFIGSPTSDAKIRRSMTTLTAGQPIRQRLADKKEISAPQVRHVEVQTDAEKLEIRASSMKIDASPAEVIGSDATASLVLEQGIETRRAVQSVTEAKTESNAMTDGKAEEPPLLRLHEQVELFRSRFAQKIDLTRIPIGKKNSKLWPAGKIVKFIDIVYDALWERIRFTAQKTEAEEGMVAKLLLSISWDILSSRHTAANVNEKAMELLESICATLQENDDNASCCRLYTDYLTEERSMYELTFYLYAKALCSKLPRVIDLLDVLFGDMPRAHTRARKEGGKDPMQEVLIAYRTNCDDIPQWAATAHAFVITDCRNTFICGKVSHCLGLEWSGGYKSLGALMHMVHRGAVIPISLKVKEIPMESTAVCMLSESTAFSRFHSELKRSFEMCDNWLADTISTAITKKHGNNLLQAVLHALMSRVDICNALVPFVLQTLEQRTPVAELDSL